MTDPTTSTSYEVPKWAGIPPTGYHLDVMKEGKLVQKLMIDEKNHYLFGRNLSMTDFCIDHASCSRVHAALVYHKNLNRFFLVDLGSTHGSFIGNIRIEEHKPTQLPVDSQFHFGASTRIYVLREKPKQNEITLDSEAMMSLPEYENEVDHLTEYNTAQNRRVSMLGVSETDDIKPATARKRKFVQFKADDEIINPEDVDPNVGRFRNLIQTSIIPSGSKRLKMEHHSSSSSSNLYSTLFNNPSSIRINPSTSSSHSTTGSSSISQHNLLAKNPLLGIHLPNPAPEIQDNDDKDEPEDDTNNVKKVTKASVAEKLTLYDQEDLLPMEQDVFGGEHGPGHKKKYAKEAWPGHEKTASLTNF